MNINTLRKNYDKLNPKERFAAIMAAASRNDEQEHIALLQSAPRKAFTVPNTYGLSEAFIFLSMWHVMNQLGLIAHFYYIPNVINDENEIIRGVKIENKPFSYGDAMDFLAKRILTNSEAWRALCNEYGVDPDYLLSIFPYIEMIEVTELIMRAMNHESSLELTDLPDLENTINGYREVIESKRKEWE
jgi:hypothetical protein